MNKTSGKLKKIQELCLSKDIMISTAESCTGGYLSKLLTDISGSSKFPFFLMLAQKFVIKFSSFFFGKYSTNAILDYMTDVTWNKKFKPNKTTHDWISSDPDNVENYVKDELCGFSVTNSMWNDIAYGCTKAFDKKNYKNCNVNLPILLIAGTNDPVSNFGKGMNALNELLGQVFINIKHIKKNNIPICFLGSGESIDDLSLFDMDLFLESIIGEVLID